MRLIGRGRVRHFEYCIDPVEKAQGLAKVCNPRYFWDFVPTVYPHPPQKMDEAPLQCPAFMESVYYIFKSGPQTLHCKGLSVAGSGHG